MDENAVVKYISETFEGVEVLASEGTYFFFYGPERMHPFVTLVTNDAHDPGIEPQPPFGFPLEYWCQQRYLPDDVRHSTGLSP